MTDSRVKSEQVRLSLSLSSSVLLATVTLLYFTSVRFFPSFIQFTLNFSTSPDQQQVIFIDSPSVTETSGLWIRPLRPLVVAGAPKRSAHEHTHFLISLAEPNKVVFHINLHRILSKDQRVLYTVSTR